LDFEVQEEQTEKESLAAAAIDKHVRVADSGHTNTPTETLWLSVCR